MVKINVEQAREFLEKINKNDRVAIITHDDMDGFCSGRLLLEFCKKKKCDIKVFILAYGRISMRDFGLEKFNKIILADLAPSFVWEEFRNLKDKKILYTDHHQEDTACPIEDFVLELRTTSSGYIPSSKTCLDLTAMENKEFGWLAILGIISDMGHLHDVNKKFLDDAYLENNKNFQFYFTMTKKLNSIILYFAPDFDRAFNEFIQIKNLENLGKVEDYSKAVSEEFLRLSKDFAVRHELMGKIIYYEIESKFPTIKSTLITALSGENKDKIYIFVSKKSERLSASARNQFGKYDVSKILKDCTAEFKNSQAGGHKSAAGVLIDPENLEKFKENLQKIKIEDYKR